MLDGFPSSSKSPLHTAFVANVSQNTAESSQARACDRPLRETSTLRGTLYLIVTEQSILFRNNFWQGGGELEGRKAGAGQERRARARRNRRSGPQESGRKRSVAGVEAVRKGGGGRGAAGTGSRLRCEAEKSAGGGQGCGAGRRYVRRNGGQGRGGGRARRRARGRARTAATRRARAGARRTDDGPTAARGHAHEEARTEPEPCAEAERLGSTNEGGEAHEAETNVSRETFVPR